MAIFRSVIRFITTLGGLLSTRIDQETDSLATTPGGVRAAYRRTRDEWTGKYHEVRDAVSQLLMVMEQKRAELNRLQAEQAELDTKKRGAVEKFRQTRDPQFQTLFNDLHTRLTSSAARQEVLAREVTELEAQVEKYKARLQELQRQIKDLDRREAEAIADIVSSRQIIELNDRLQGMGTSLHDENLQAIEQTRQKLKAKATLSDQLSGADTEALEREALKAGMSTEAADEFQKLLAEGEGRQDGSQKQAPGTERVM